MKDLILDRFNEKTIIFTGMLGDVCRETALRAAKEGARIVLAEQNKGTGDKLVEDIKVFSPRVELICNDFSETGNCNSLIEKTLRLFGSVDIFIDNVSNCCSDPGSKDCNIFNPSELVESVLSTMVSKKKGGSVIAISGNVAGEECIRTMADKYRSSNIFVNEVIPCEQAEDTADLVLHLASERGHGISGKIIRTEEDIKV